MNIFSHHAGRRRSADCRNIENRAVFDRFQLRTQLVFVTVLFQIAFEFNAIGKAAALGIDFVNGNFFRPAKVSVDVFSVLCCKGDSHNPPLVYKK